MNCTTHRLEIRPIGSGDASQVFAYHSDKQANQYQGWIPETIEDVTEFIERCGDTWNAPGTWFQLVILLKVSRQLVGDIGVHFTGTQNLQVELGITLNSECQGQGYATEAMGALIDYLFIEMRKHRIFASVDPGNHRSIHLLEKLGFRKEAHLKESLFLRGEWVDDLQYAILDREWIKQY